MNNICLECGTMKKLIPAGVSKKTGNAYSSFWACPNKCGKKEYNTKSNLDPLVLLNERIDEWAQKHKDLERRVNLLEGNGEI